MRIGITCNIQGQGGIPAAGPDDVEEEFDKPETVEAIANVLREFGHEVAVLGDGESMLRRVLQDPPDFVFNFAEGTGVSRSREARVPAALEMLGIPYSGSDPLALAATLDKDCCKRLVQSAGVQTPKWITVCPPIAAERSHELESDAATPAVWAEIDQAADRLAATGIDYPVIVKPAYEGSSKGIRQKCLVESAAELTPLLAELTDDYRQPVLIEEFIVGDEVTVGVIGNESPRVLGIMKIIPQDDRERDRFVYSLEVKRDYVRRVRYEIPALLSDAASRSVEQSALSAYQVLGCRDVSRLDFRIRGDEAYLLEVNPLPGLNPVTGDLVLLARGLGISHAKLVEKVFDAACARCGLESRTKSSNFLNV